MRRLLRPLSLSHALMVGGVAFIAGLLFATSATVFAGADQSTARNLPALVQEENDRLTTRNEEVDALRAEVNALEAELQTTIGDPTAEVALAVGLEELTGPGLTVTLSDAPASVTSDNPDDLVVHQQDLQAVVNALWAGGAEAVAIQGQRVIATTAVRCVGNVLLLNGRTYSPPYRVEAIGPVAAMEKALDADAAVRLYLRYVEAYDLGWTVTESDALTIPAHDGAGTLAYATPIED